MHYIRCLRPPKVMSVGEEQHIEFLFVISTDLGDSLLCPDEPIGLKITTLTTSTTGLQAITALGCGSVQGKHEKLEWKAGQRVFKKKFKVSRDVKEALQYGRPVEITITTEKVAHRAYSAQSMLEEDASKGKIMPLDLTLNPENPEDKTVTLRKIQYNILNLERFLSVAEDIGEPKSLARHVWDGGVVTASALISSAIPTKPKACQGDVMGAFRAVLEKDRDINMLELGCGVGVLGLGAALLAKETRKQHRTAVLMTDLEDAEEQVRGNIARNEDLTKHGENENSMQLLYENLDWEDGRKGRFGREIAARRWDLIMFSDCTYNVDVLPALVQTLDKVHLVNVHHQGENVKHGTSVFMATKPRHTSEDRIFHLLSESRWELREKQTIMLPVLGGEDQSVELYWLKKD